MVLINENNFAKFKFDKPNLIISVKKDGPTDEEWNWTKETMISYYKSLKISNTKISIIFDLTNLGLLNLNIYQDWANLFLEYKSYTEKYIHRTSIISDSLVIRTSLNLFFQIYTTVRPMKFVNNFKEAETFVNTQDNDS